MPKRNAVTVASLLVCLALGACGSDKSKMHALSYTTTPPTTSVPPNTTNPNPVAQSAIDACKASISSSQRIPKATKAQLEKMCQKAGSRDRSGARAASRAVCRQIVSSSLPPGPTREKALASCGAPSK